MKVYFLCIFSNLILLLSHFQEELERKKQEQLQRKAESKASLEEEISKIKIGGKQTLSKVTRAEIEVCINVIFLRFLLN